jgi:hypothetical protein
VAIAMTSTTRPHTVTIIRVLARRFMRQSLQSVPEGSLPTDSCDVKALSDA